MPRPLRLILVLALLGLLPAPVLAGGSKADYARAARLAREVRNRVANLRLAGVWLASREPDRERAHGHYVYKHEEPDGSWRYRRADAERGTIEPAFDHAAVARALAGILARPVSAGKLPLALIGGTADRLRVQAGARVFEIAAPRSLVRELDLEALPEARLAPVRVRRSEGGGADTAILFLNRSSAAVELVWLAHDGSRKSYGNVPAGAERRQHTYPGHVWAVVQADGTELGVYQARPRPGVVLVTGTPERAKAVRRTSARTSPDGRFRIRIDNHNVVLVDTKEKKRHALSSDGTAEDPYVPRVSWSPKGRYVMVVRERPGGDRRVHVVESAPAEGVQPKLRSWGYLKPGDPIAQPRPRLFDVKTLSPVGIGDELFTTPWSISRFSWSDDGTCFRFLYNERGHQVLRFMELDAIAGTARPIIDEGSETFIDYSQKTHLERIGKTDTWLWMSERDGHNHLYRVDAKSGAARQLTKGAWVVRRVIEVAPPRGTDAGHVLFEAVGVHAGQDPYYRHVGRVGLDGKGLTWLTDADGTHEVAFSPDKAWFVDRWSRVDAAPVHVLRSAADGRVVATLARADTKRLEALGWAPPERFHAKGRDGKTDIHGVLWRPSTFDPAKRYPVIESIYAGPHGQFVPKAFRVWSGQRALAELGFVVVQIDGMGTNWRSKAFHDVCWKNLGDAGIPDRVLWLRAAAKTRPWMDLSRVGIYGGSAGGQSALRAMLVAPDVYHVGVADCGCHDNRMDKIWWNEAWMGWPIGPHYVEQSNVTQAHRLEGKLLLIVGELDRNVDPASTMQVVKALIEADKDFDLLVMPGVGHGAAGTPYGRRRLRDFFVRHLLQVEPRSE